MLNTMRFKKKWLLILPLFLLWLYGCYHYVGVIETNQVWMIYPPPNHDFVEPYADKKDPNILYLLKVGEEHTGKKIDLRTREITECSFPIVQYKEPDDQLKEEAKYVNRYDRGDAYDFPNMPASEEFRGRTLSHPTFHLYGYPFAIEPGIRKAEPQFGYWYIMDMEQGRKVELLRIRVWNSENPRSLGLGRYDISPDKKWGVFIAENNNCVYIFNRETQRPETIQ